jgi:GT2 family glycosyltransferase
MISIVIPTYKNKEQLLQNLSANLSFLKECEIIVVNDYPQDNLSELSKFKNIKLIHNEKNLGFGQSVNRGVHAALHKYVMLLNSDVVLHDDSFQRAEILFSDSNLFAVSFLQHERNEHMVGKNTLFWKHGLMHHRGVETSTAGNNGWAEGGSCIVDKDKFLKLGGFDSLYAPFYWEDIDLSYRAWKSGYRTLFTPEIRVEHHHESTIGKYFSNTFIKTISYRNQFLFVWKNITDSSLFFSHLLSLFPLTVLMLIKGEFAFLKGLVLAITKLGSIINRRRMNDKIFKLSDKEVLKRIHE